MKNISMADSTTHSPQTQNTIESNRVAKMWLLSLGLIFIVQVQVLAQNENMFENLKFKTNSTSEVYEYVIKTKSGSTYIGELLGVKYKKLEILNKDVGELQIAISDIVSIDPVGSDVSPSLAYQASQRGQDEKQKQMIGGSHYFISPSSYTLKKNEGEFQVTYIFFLSGSYGITDNFSIAAGFSILPAVSFNEQLFYLIPRVSFPVTPNIRLGAQMTFLTVSQEELSLLALTSTFGSEDKNITIGLSYGLSNGEFIRVPVINIAGVLRVSNKVALLMDNYILTDEIASDDILFSGGVRILSGDSAFDLGIWSVAGGDEQVGIPYINYTLRF